MLDIQLLFLSVLTSLRKRIQWPKEFMKYASPVWYLLAGRLSLRGIYILLKNSVGMPEYICLITARDTVSNPHDLRTLSPAYC